MALIGRNLEIKGSGILFPAGGFRRIGVQMKCLEKKVAFVPGGSFFPNGGHENTLRLNYSCMPEEKIVQGITALCQTIRENLK